MRTGGNVMSDAQFKRLIAFAKKNRLTRIRVGDYEADLSPQSWLSKRELKVFESALDPISPEDKTKLDEEELYYSS